MTSKSTVMQTRYAHLLTVLINHAVAAANKTPLLVWEMAIFRLEIKPIRRSEGRDARAAAAYRSGTRIGPHDYTRRRGVEHTELFAPATSCIPDRAELWNQAEDAERRKNSVVAREVLIALPHELPQADRIALIRQLAGWLVSRYGVAVDAALHAPRSGHDERNHHAHLLMTTRRMSYAGLGEKTRELDDNRTTGPREIAAIRAAWCAMVNAYGFNLDYRARRSECAMQLTSPRPSPTRRADPRLQPQF
jgi:MobA/MobL family